MLKSIFPNPLMLSSFYIYSSSNDYLLHKSGFVDLIDNFHPFIIFFHLIYLYSIFLLYNIIDKNVIY